VSYLNQGRRADRPDVSPPAQHLLAAGDRIEPLTPGEWCPVEGLPAGPIEGTVTEPVAEPASPPSRADRRRGKKGHRGATPDVAPAPASAPKPDPGPSSLGEAFPLEQARCRELLEQYRSIGPNGLFGAMGIEDVLRRADRAAIEGNVVEMIRLYEEMRDLK
jgi:hypothetical protein